MGVTLKIWVSTLVPKEKWNAVYEEALELAKRLGIAESKEKEVHGHMVNCLSITEESEWNDKKGWWAVADYRQGDSCEGFFFPKELCKPKSNDLMDILAKYAYDIDLIITEVPGENYQCIWGDNLGSSLTNPCEYILIDIEEIFIGIEVAGGEHLLVP